MLIILIVCIAWNTPHGRPRGIYNNHLLNFLHSKQANIWLEHPIHIKDSLGMIRGKNDKVDAQRIANYAYKNRDEVRLWVPKRDVIQKLDRLTALRSRLIKARKIRTADADAVSFDRLQRFRF
jgi:transposase